MEPTTKQPARPGYRLRRILPAFRQRIQWLEDHRQARRHRAALARLPEHLLRDIGQEELARRHVADLPRF